MKETMVSDRVQFTKRQLFYFRIKRLLDVLISLVSLILLLPVFLIVAIAIKAEDPKGPVFYAQERIGRSGRPFKVYKFRSMRVNAPELSTSEFYNAQSYVTRTGRFLRDTSIDELPQLFNVLIGNMSLIGPRPLMPRERDIHIKRFYYGLYQIRPGITGMAQTHGRDNVDPIQKVEWDRKYAEQISLMTDFKLLFSTFFKVLKREGVEDKNQTASDTSGHGGESEMEASYKGVSEK